MSFVSQVITKASRPSHLNMFELGVWCKTKLWSALPALLQRRWWAFYACTCVRAQTHKHTVADSATPTWKDLGGRKYRQLQFHTLLKILFLSWVEMFCWFSDILWFTHHCRYRQEAKKTPKQNIYHVSRTRVRFRGQVWGKILESDVHTKGHI